MADSSEHSSMLQLSTEEALECPFCFTSIEIDPLKGIYWDVNNLQIFLKCKKCRNIFIGYASLKNDGFHINRLSQGSYKITKFNAEINSTSSLFCQIYGESEFAEQNGLKQICGAGYRKALEFLIKDYLIKKDPSNEEKIKTLFLGDCIEDMVDNPRIKEIAKRAVWLGNDETHYIREWKDKDLEDLKRLIGITVHFISIEIESEKYMGEMK